MAARAITFFLQPIRYVTYWIYARQSKYRRFKSRRAQFWGDLEFEAAARNAVEQLDSLDPDIAAVLHKWPFTIVQYPSRLEVFVTSRLSTVDDNFLRWGSDGILACIIYAVMIVRHGQRSWSLLGDQTKVDAVFTAAQASTAEWLGTHGMPNELVTSFRAAPAPSSERSFKSRRG